jgi:hypothetical protein
MLALRRWRTRTRLSEAVLALRRSHTPTRPVRIAQIAIGSLTCRLAGLSTFLVTAASRRRPNRSYAMPADRLCNELRELRDDYRHLFEHARFWGRPAPSVPVQELNVILRQAARVLRREPAFALYRISADELQHRFRDRDSARADAAREIVGHALAGTLKAEMLARVDPLVLTMITCVVEVMSGKEPGGRC